jgi:2-keto-4-pentenoate hydratase/2-oxohepta-3-ene-1,7-dioic acid hydratase in catechol pathway
MGNSNLQSGRVFCIGRNYVEHIRELSNATPTKPLFFIKPASCLVKPGEKIHFPKHGNELHHEVEVVVQISRGGKVKNEEEARNAIGFLTLGLDLTLRDVQDEQKKKGLPWEIAKAFDQSSPLGNFIPFDKSIDLNNISFSCKVNGIEKQRGNTEHMMISIQKQLMELSTIWSLLPGDLLYTGTPSGVGPLKIGDTIEITSDAIGSFAWSIIE